MILGQVERQNLTLRGPADHPAGSLSRERSSSEAGESATGPALLIFCDARIDNRTATLEALKLPQSASDSTIILAAYQKWGKDCPKRLLGDFAFVIVDAAASTIFCARDHIGARPFFYALDTDRLLFAGNIKAMLEADPRLNQLDQDFVVNKLVYIALPTPDRTFFVSIKKLAPGHSLTITPDEIVNDRYWSADDVTHRFKGSEQEAVGQARSLLETAVNDRLRGYERPAVHLSGGLDSSAVAALATNHQRARSAPDPLAYAWYSGDATKPDDNETRWIEAARNALELEVFAPSLDSKQMTDLFRSDWCEAPDMANLFHEAAVQIDAESKGVDTILSGWGGDESLSFNGRGYQAELLLKLRWGKLARLAGGIGPVSLLRGIKRGIGEYRTKSTYESKDRQAAKSYLQPNMKDTRRLFDLPSVRLRNSHEAITGLIGTHALTARLEDWAISGQARGIDYSYPMLDRRVMEFALSLPGHMFLKPGRRRWLIREILDPKLPDLIRENDIKLERARVGRLNETIHQALLTCADLLESAEDLGDRGDQIDMKRLIADLRRSKEDMMYNVTRRRRALQFLRF